MKQNHLRIVQDNTLPTRKGDTPQEAAEFDFQLLLARAKYVFALARLILMFPFRVLGVIGPTTVAVGRGFFSGIVKLFLGVFGLALIGMLAFGLIRVIFYPMFH